MFLLPDDAWEIRNTPLMGRAVFAKKPISQGAIIGDYLGTVVQMSEYDVGNDAQGLYLMYLTDDACVYPDVHSPGLHCINHSCTPNSWMYIYKGHTLFVAIRTILPGEEIAISYCLSPKDDTCENCTHKCYCGSENCTGSMHFSKTQYVLWKQFLKSHMMHMKTPLYTYGKQLMKLSAYPLSIPVDPIYQHIISEVYP